MPHVGDVVEGRGAIKALRRNVGDGGKRKKLLKI